MDQTRGQHAIMVDPQRLAPSIYVFEVRRPRTFYGECLVKGQRLEISSEEKEKLSRALTLSASLSGAFRHTEIRPVREPKLKGRGVTKLTRMTDLEKDAPIEGFEDDETI